MIATKKQWHMAPPVLAIERAVVPCWLLMVQHVNELGLLLQAHKVRKQILPCNGAISQLESQGPADSLLRSRAGRIRPQVGRHPTLMVTWLDEIPCFHQAQANDAPDSSWCAPRQLLRARLLCTSMCSAFC